MCLKNWDKKEYGEYAEADVVTENVFGQLEKGIWRSQGREGHFELEEFEEVAVAEHTVQHNDTGAFAEQALERRRTAALSAVHAQSQARADVALAAPPGLSLSDIMAVLKADGNGAVSSGSVADAGVVPTPGTEEAAEEDVPSDKSDSEAEGKRTLAACFSMPQRIERKPAPAKLRPAAKTSSARRTRPPRPKPGGAGNATGSARARQASHHSGKPAVAHPEGLSPSRSSTRGSCGAAAPAAVAAAGAGAGAGTAAANPVPSGVKPQGAQDGAAAAGPGGAPAMGVASNAPAASREVAVLDGRASRMREGICESIAGIRELLNAEPFNETCAEVAKKGVWATRQLRRAKNLGAAVAKIKAQQKRIDRSNNGVLYGDLIEELDTLMVLAETMAAVNSSLRDPAADREQWAKAKSAADAANLKLSAPYHVHHLRTQLAGALAFDDFDHLCSMFQTTCPEVRVASDRGWKSEGGMKEKEGWGTGWEAGSERRERRQMREATSPWRGAWKRKGVSSAGRRPDDQNFPGRGLAGSFRRVLGRPRSQCC